MFTRKVNNRWSLGLAALVALAILVGGASQTNAQDVAVGQATATVLAVLAVTASQDLQFGDVLQGVPNSVDHNTDAASGIFRITGEAGNQVDAYMQLPDYVALADGSDRMVISFSSTDAEYNGTAAAVPADAGTETNPHNIPSLTLGAGGDMAIFLGGTVFPTVDQSNGSYAGDIVLTVAYNGS